MRPDLAISPLPPGPPVAAQADPEDTLAAALLDSRARWRDLAMLGADLLFETDAAGRLTFVAPENPLGHEAASLLGRPLAALRAEPAAPDPFVAGPPPDGLRLWLRRADGEAACLEFTALPAGEGLRGIARDVTEEERRAEATARTLRRATALMRLLGRAQRSRVEAGGAAAAIASLLEGTGPALGCAGAALLEWGDGGWVVQAEAGTPGALPPAGELPALPRCTGGQALIPVAEGVLLAAWREAPLDGEDLGVLAALGPPLAGLRAEAARQRLLDRAARTDPLTGLLNRRGFAEALERGRAERPEGVLAYVDMDGLKRLNDRHGHAAGDAAIRTLAARLAAAALGEALAARLGGDEFALWLPGDDLEAARARCIPVARPGPLPGLPEAGPEAVAASFGLAAAGAEDSAATLLERADAAMYARKASRRAA